MNPPGSREELEQMGFSFERRTKCPGPRCGATVEWWRKVPGPQIAFRVSLRTGKLIQHAEECPDAKQSKTKPAEERPVRPAKPKQAEVPRTGDLFP